MRLDWGSRSMTGTLQPLLLQGGTEVDGRRRLGDAALLVGERENFRTRRSGAGHPPAAERGSELAGCGFSHRIGVSRHHRGILPEVRYGVMRTMLLALAPLFSLFGTLVPPPGRDVDGREPGRRRRRRAGRPRAGRAGVRDSGRSPVAVPHRRPRRALDPGHAAGAARPLAAAGHRRRGRRRLRRLPAGPRRPVDRRRSDLVVPHAARYVGADRARARLPHLRGARPAPDRERRRARDRPSPVQHRYRRARGRSPGRPLGDHGTWATRKLRHSADGRTWTAGHAIPERRQGEAGLRAAGDGTVYATFGAFRTFRTRNGGRTWTKLTHRVLGVGPGSLVYGTAQRDRPVPDPGLTVSYNRGSTWTHPADRRVRVFLSLVLPLAGDDVLVATGAGISGPTTADATSSAPTTASGTPARPRSPRRRRAWR